MAIRGRATSIHPGELVWLLGGLAQLFRIPFDARLVQQQFPPPHSLATLISAARAIGLRTGECALKKRRFAALPMPCLGFLRADARSTPAILLRADAKRLLFLRAGSQTPETLPLEELEAKFEPRGFLIARDEEGGRDGADEDPAGIAAARFGFRWFVPELLKHKRIWRDVIIASLMIQVLGLATPLFTQVTIDKVIVHRTESTLLAIGIALGMFMLFSAGMTWLRQYLVLHTGNRIDAVLGSQVFSHVMRLPLRYFEHRATGIVVARMHGIETVREFITGAAVTLLLDLPFLVIFLAVMIAYSWQLTLMVLVALALIAAASLLVTPFFRSRLNAQFLLGARNQAFLTEYVSGIETVKSLQVEPGLDGRYGNYLASYLAASFKARQLANSYNVFANGIEQAMTLGILIVGALLVMQTPGFTIGMLVAFQMFASRVSQPMLRLANLWQEFQQADIAVKRLADLMDAPAEEVALVPRRLFEGKGAIEIKGLGFRYGADRPWLYRNLDISIRAGSLVAITGASGSGKSTLAKLLQGLYEAPEGQLLIDGQETRYLAANELRAVFGVVPQETRLFSGPVIENIRMASPLATLEEVTDAARQAEIHEFIQSLPEGYETVIGENGVGLSGGQKQRISIARALLKKPRILIFDEATTNLDQITAMRIAETVNGLRGKATILFIAHQVPGELMVDDSIELGGRG